MLDETIVNILRRRNMSEEKKRQAPKWQRTLRTVEWLAAQLPLDAEFQLYGFNESVQSYVTDDDLDWQPMSDGSALNAGVDHLSQAVPAGGTNLESLMLAVRELSPIPDNIYLITDGLPTRAAASPRNPTVDGRTRLKLFREAANRLPRQIPVNVILFPMEGDPMASAAWWQLARPSLAVHLSPFLGLAMIRRRGIEEFSVSFLDVICCGFGAVILLLMLTKTLEPQVLESSNLDPSERIAARENALFELRGQIEQLRQRLQEEQKPVDDSEQQRRNVQSQLTEVLARYATLLQENENISTENQQLASARQSLTDEMEQLLGLDFRRESGLVGGISVDSEYIIFVIDTSGSMQSAAWGQVVQKVSETLSIYPQIKGIQVMNDMGDYMFPNYRRRWIEDTPALRNSIIQTLQKWAPFSNSSPVEGIREAIGTYYDPNKRISIYVFGDDHTGDSIEDVVRAVDLVNRADDSGRRRVRIHAIGFPVYLDQPNARIYRFAALMRELAYRNDGTFVGLTEYQSNNSWLSFSRQGRHWLVFIAVSQLWLCQHTHRTEQRFSGPLGDRLGHARFYCFEPRTYELRAFGICGTTWRIHHQRGNGAKTIVPALGPGHVQRP